MSYRAFKRLLGETSLERKCRFLFGGFIVLLMFLSFSLYANRTDSLAYEQINTTSRMLVEPLVAHRHLGTKKKEAAFDEFRGHWEDASADTLRQRKTRFIKPDTSDEADRQIYNKFATG